MTASVTTYSFQDVVATFSCPGVGVKSSDGAGLGSISIVMTQTKTVQEAAADGSIMVSKILGENGTIALQIQQTSQLHKWLLDNWYNYINQSSNTSDWAAMTIIIKSNALTDSTTCIGVSPQKLPDRPYQSQGQLITWNFLAAKITQE
jgi:hypothetical protein